MTIAATKREEASHVRLNVDLWIVWGEGYHMIALSEPAEPEEWVFYAAGRAVPAQLWDAQRIIDFKRVY